MIVLYCVVCFIHSQAKDKTAKNRQKIVQSQEKLQHQARQEVRGGGEGRRGGREGEKKERLSNGDKEGGGRKEREREEIRCCHFSSVRRPNNVVRRRERLTKRSCSRRLTLRRQGN